MLRLLFQKDIIPSISEPEEDKECYSLTYFRKKYVWTEEVNDMIEANMEGIMNVFTKFMEVPPLGFTNRSALRMLKGIASSLSDRDI